MTPTFLLTIFALAIALASIVGGEIGRAHRPTHTRMQLAISFVGGLMLGIALFHLLPHAIYGIKVENLSIDRLMLWMIVGMLTMFFLLRVFNFHHHEIGEEDHDEQITAAACHGATCHGHKLAHPYSWVGVMIGLSLHTIIDGIALGASVLSEVFEARADVNLTSSLPGLGTFFAVLLHQPLDALSIMALMTAGGWSRRTQKLVNFTYAFLCPLGAMAFYFGLGGMFIHNATTISCALAYSAGVFVCISLGDLLPEISFHSHDRTKLSIALLLGLSFAYCLRFVENLH